MNIKQLAKNKGFLLKLRPRPIGFYNPDAYWMLDEVDEKERVIKLSNIETGYVARLGGDAVKSFESNAQRPRSGYLMLRRQLIADGCNLHCEPI